MKKIFAGTLIALCVGAEAQAQAMEDGVTITFFPVYEKAEKLVTVELVTSVRYASRYRALEQSVMKNDWRPLFPGSDGVNPGKCIVHTVESRYVIDCQLASSNKNRAHALKAIMKTPKDVIATVQAFSKNR